MVGRSCSRRMCWYHSLFMAVFLGKICNLTGNLTGSNILACEALFVQRNDDGTCFLAGKHCWQMKNNDSKQHPPFEASSLLFKLNQHDSMIYSLVLVNTHTCVNERITDIMSAGPFVAGLKCSGNVFWGFSSFSWQRGTQLIWSLFKTFWSICKLPLYKLRQQTLWKLIFVSFSKLLATSENSEVLLPLAEKKLCVVFASICLHFSMGIWAPSSCIVAYSPLLSL